ncbi:MAG: 2-vinyl bacteriochlorophyllide hydratase [Xanthomonadales bacterium]|nr:2-vinyl bacteriochlorophyllide hydratase [Xanthomonadales bacterium]
MASISSSTIDPSVAPRPSSGDLYTPEQRLRRDASRWTLVQGVLAPLQFVIFLVSLVLVLRFLATGEGAMAATASVVIKTLVLYAIMITGSAWEKDVFGQWLFVPAFFWEDVVSMGVLALHTAYLACWAFGWLGVEGQMWLALAAYAAYVLNAAQFLVKFRRARRAPAPINDALAGVTR